MRVVTFDTGIIGRLDRFVADNQGRIDRMTLDAEFGETLIQNRRDLGAMRGVTISTIIPGRLVDHAVLPILGDPRMTTETQNRALFVQEAFAL